MGPTERTLLPAVLLVVSASVAAPSCKRDEPPAPTVAELIAQLDGPDAFAAGKQLATFEDRAALVPHLSELIVALSHEDWQITSLAAEAIGRVGTTAIPALVAVLDNGPASAQRPAVDAMGHIGVTAVANLRDALGHGNKDVREGAQFALRDLGSAALPALIAGLQSDDPVLRSNAAQTVQSMPDEVLPENPSELAGALSNALGRSSDDIGSWAMVNMLLTRLGPAGLGAIVSELHNDHPAVHGIVLSALSACGDGVLETFTPEYVAQLTTAVVPFLEADDGGRQACEVFERLGPRASGAIPALVAKLHARAAERKQHGTTSNGWPDCPAYALAMVGADAVGPATRLLATDDRWVRTQALLLLAEIGPPAKSAASAIEELVRDEPSLQREADKTLASIGAAR